ncbi:hypothetical protein N7516_000430 [Penicillium verrucosum]|uniref:uncharacterized protein n=1 Tax=Penicillium verrucosum TaxID=60171 RepID=UPI0025457233|nr:uncharacterized protein N7516_000430 [Penicillium verrucosum]KAJ5940262.1 hypothetical protein N7516_000430 [Penicillium verrucosum]
MTPKFKPAMNPTVEDEVIDDVPANQNSNSNANANDTPVPWSEIFSRHEAVLCSHLEMLSMVKEQIAPKVNGFQTVSSMVNKTVLAMNQLKIARKHMMSSKSHQTPTPEGRKKSTYPTLYQATETGIDMTALENATPSSSNPTQSTDTEANTRKKRRRISRDNDTARPECADEIRAPKRSRDSSSSQPTPEQDAEFASTLETEDISAEVQRRLKIKEEQRLKKENPKADKRKRDSLVSNEGESPIASKPRKKRLRLGNEYKRHGELMDNDADAPKKKQR